MTVARELADFLTPISAEELPVPAMEHAAMLIASTIASAALGAGIEFGADRPRARPREGRTAGRAGVV